MECVIIYSSPSRNLVFNKERQAFIYHAYVHLGFAAADTATAFSRHFGAYNNNRLYGRIVQALVEYINVQATTTSINPVQELYAPYWSPDQADHWRDVLVLESRLRDIVYGYRNPDPTFRVVENYYQAPVQPLVTYETAMGYSSPTSTQSRLTNDPQRNYDGPHSSTTTAASSSHQRLPQIAVSSSQSHRLLASGGSRKILPKPAT